MAWTGIRRWPPSCRSWNRAPFSGAARLLNVGQPAVSKTIAQLENRLQVSLLVRSTHGLSPTEAGLRFYERARGGHRGGGRGRARRPRRGGRSLGTAARLGGDHLRPAPRGADAAALPRRAPGPRHRDRPRRPGDRPRRRGDRPVPAHGDFAGLGRRRTQARHRGRSVLATPAYLARAGEPRSPADLAGHEAVVYSRQPDAWSFTRDGAEISVAVHGRAGSARPKACVRPCWPISGSPSRASDWMFAPELASGAVRRLLQPWALPMIDLWAVFPTGRMASAKARLFAGFVEAVMAEMREPHSATA